MTESEERAEMIAAVVRRFAEERISPRVDALERGEETPYALMREMSAALGFREFAEGAAQAGSAGDGGAGGRADPALSAILLRELSRVLPGFALSFGASLGLCGQTIIARGTPAQKQRWAVPVLACEKIGCWGLTEPDAGSSALADMRTTARRDGRDYVVTGSKTLITNAPYADVMVIYAKLDDGVAAFVLDRGMEGLTTSKPFDKMGMRSSPTGAIYMENVRCGPERLLGEREPGTGGGKKETVEALLGERGGLTAMAVGILERAVEEAVKYARDRRVHGRPIGELQAVQLRLARMQARLETARALMEKGFRLMREGRRDTVFFCSAKLMAAELAVEGALDAVQVLGGNGYMSEFRVEMLARDAKLLEIGGGTSDIQLLAIARELMRT